MKKLHLAVATLFIGIAGLVYAGNQYNWGTSTGGAWSTPDDTLTTPNQALSIGNGGGAGVIPANNLGVGSTNVALSTAITSGNSQGVFGSAFLSGTTASVEGSVLCATTAVNGLQAVVVCPVSAGTFSPRIDWVGVAKNAVSTGSVVDVYYSGFVLVQTTQTVITGDILSVSSTTAGFAYASTTFQNLTSTQAMVGTLNGVIGVAQAAGNSAGGLTKVRLR